MNAHHICLLLSIVTILAAVCVDVYIGVNKLYTALATCSIVFLAIGIYPSLFAKPEPIVVVTTPSKPTISPHQRLVKEIDELVKKKLGRKLPQEAIKALVVATDGTNLDPKLVLAVIEVESKFRPLAKSDSSTGLMQINAGVWKLQEHVLTDPALNIKHGVRILKGYIKDQGSVKRGLTAYNQGPKPMSEGIFDYSYYNKVMKIYNKLGVKHV